MQSILAMSDDDPRKLDEIRRFSAIYGRFDCKRKAEKPLSPHEVIIHLQDPPPPPSSPACRLHSRTNNKSINNVAAAVKGASAALFPPPPPSALAAADSQPIPSRSECN